MAIYGLGGMLTKSLQFFLLPLYTRILVPSEYGILELVYVWGNILSILFGLMINSGFARIYYENKEDRQQKKVFSSAFWFTIVSIVIIIIPTLLFGGSLIDQLFSLKDGLSYFNIIAFSMAVFSVNTLLYTFLIVREKAQQYVIANVSSLVVTASASIYLVVVQGIGVAGILYAQLLGYSVECIVLTFLISSDISLKYFSAGFIKQMLVFSLPLIPVQVSSYILNLSSRYFLNKYGSLDDVGVYAIGFKIASIIPLFATQPLKAFGPYLFSLVDDQEKCKQAHADFTRYYTLGIMVIVMIISLFSSEVIRIVAPAAYQESWKIIYPLSLSFALYGIGDVLCYVLYVAKSTIMIGVLWVASAIITVLMNYLLVPEFGIIGAAICIVISYLIISLGYWLTIKKIYPVRYENTLIGGTFLLTNAICFIPYIVQTTNILSIGLKLTILALFLLVIAKIKYFRTAEIELVRCFVKKVFRLNG